VGELRDVTGRDRLDVDRAAALVSIFEQAQDRSARVLSDLAKLGIADRAVRIEEAKAALLIEMVTTAMKRTNIPPTSQAEVWAVLRELIAARQAEAEPQQVVPLNRRIRPAIEGPE
jgi:hypothetical protein